MINQATRTPLAFQPTHRIRVEGDTSLQNPLQAAVAKVSVTSQVAAKVIEVCGEEYLPVSDLLHKPGITQLVRDANHLSIVLSDAYTQGKLGRINHHAGTTRYAYGAPNPDVAMISQKKTAVKKQVKRGLVNAPFIGKPPAEKITAHRPYLLTLEFADAEEALAFMMRNGLVSKIVKL